MLLLVVLSRWFWSSPSIMAPFHRHCRWLFFGFFWFPHCPWVWPLIRISDYTRTTFLSDRIVAIYPPSEACFWTRPLQWRRCRQCWPMLQRHHTSIPSSCRWRPTCQKLSRIIIRRRHSDSVRRWEHPRDLESTSLWSLTVSLLLMPQPFGYRGISLIDSNGQTKVLGVEVNTEISAVFTGR